MEGSIVKIYKAPQPTPNLSRDEVSIFLAGSIDMGTAENWQTRMEHDLVDIDHLSIYNPRRDDWDSSWIQDPTPGTQFHEQVSWELDHLERANLVIVYFADDSKSPITLLELGLMLSDWGKEVAIYCSPKFYRYGNVKMVADRYHAPVYENYEDLLHHVKVFTNKP
jgi:hypothetical protein